MIKKRIFIERWTSHSKFFALQGIFNSYKKFRGKIIGCENKNIICYAREGDLRVFYDKDELENSKIIGHKFLTKKVNIIKYISDSREVKNRYLRICRLIYCTDFEKISLFKITKILKDLFNSYSALMAYYRMSAEEFYLLSELKIKEELKRYVPDINKAYQILTSCELNAKIDSFKEQIDWLLLLIKLRKTDQKIVLNSVRKHAFKFGFLGAGGGNPFGWDYNFFIKKYRIEVKNNIVSLKKRYKELINLDREILKERENLIKKYKLPKRIVNITKNISLMSYHRMIMREAITQGAYLSRSIFSHIYSLIEKSLNRNFKFDILRQFSYEEMCQFLIDGRSINCEKIRERYKFFIYILKGNKTNLYIGKEAKAIIKNLNISYDDSNAHIIKGNPTYSGGIIYGNAMVIDNAKHSLHQQKLVEVMKNGEILVTGMTRPNIILACNKASAIVTDEGGFTSHAAIISRELKKPCVIGTRKATKLIKTGDYLEVDSEKGIIKIISKIST